MVRQEIPRIKQRRRNRHRNPRRWGSLNEEEQTKTIQELDEKIKDDEEDWRMRVANRATKSRKESH